MTPAEFAFRMVFTLSFCVLLLIRLYSGYQVKKSGQNSWAANKEAVEREGLAVLAARLGGFLLLMAVFFLYLANPAWMHSMQIRIPVWLRASGLLLVLVGIMLLAWTHASLGKHWSTNLQTREGHALVTSGPYRFIRHPMYTALIAYFIGAGLLSANLLLLLIFAAGIAFMITRTGKEEAMMVETFGEQYLAYREHTGLLLPRVHQQG